MRTINKPNCLHFITSSSYLPFERQFRFILLPHRKYILKELHLSTVSGLNICRLADHFSIGIFCQTVIHGLVIGVCKHSEDFGKRVDEIENFLQSKQEFNSICK